ncbi:MAG TPA: polyphenol oxidase family protein [Solirubrobacteraceae bacterium]|nr:polyphenol oxidase family protein [Solirubrobacteraceae bacterium]
MKLGAPFYPWREHVAIDLPGARAVFTTRRGGFSGGPYESLNLGRMTDDDPALVGRNRAALQARVDGRLAMIRQVHGSRVLRITQADRITEADADRLDLEEADGQATARAGVAPMVLTADCLPIAVAGGGVVAMLHAGWRGLSGGIIDEGLRAVRELGGTEALAAAIGPGAGRCCYEVGDEVRERFASGNADVHRGGTLDLKAIARAQLERAGVAEVHDTGLCTICSPPELFFSHRRDHGVTGRQAGVAWLT